MTKIRRESNALNILHNMLSSMTPHWPISRVSSTPAPRTKKDRKAKRRRKARNRTAKASRRKNRR